MSVETFNFEATPINRDPVELESGADVAFKIARKDLVSAAVVAANRENTTYGQLDSFRQPETKAERRLSELALHGARTHWMRTQMLNEDV